MTWYTHNGAFFKLYRYAKKHGVPLFVCDVLGVICFLGTGHLENPDSYDWSWNKKG